jgi:glycerophosphoryl diester phosphodiesterase
VIVRPRVPIPALVPNAHPLVVAHRGASAAVAEHTLAAYISAIESGADALECDVRLTRDGYLVCVHDRTVDRTSDGRGVVSELDLAGLEAMDFHSWHDAWPDSADRLLSDEPYLSGVAPDRVDPAGSVLTLETLLGLVRDTGREVRLLIETKHPTRYSGLVERELVRMLTRFGWAGAPGPDRTRGPAPGARVTVMSFATTALRRIRLLAPEVPTVLLMERQLPGARLNVLPPGIGIIGPGLRVLRAEPELVSRAHLRGKQVYVWTVDEPADLEYVLGLGVDAIITNRPADTILAIGSPP